MIRLRQLMLAITLLLVLHQVSAKLISPSLTARHSNQNLTTDYTFRFGTAYSYAYAHVRIGLPI
jgi:hypothetical protein